jgi:hypothetical protein
MLVCPLFDDFVRPRQHRRRDREAEGLGCLQIGSRTRTGGLFDLWTRCPARRTRCARPFPAAPRPSGAPKTLSTRMIVRTSHGSRASADLDHGLPKRTDCNDTKVVVLGRSPSWLTSSRGSGGLVWNRELPGLSAQLRLNICLAIENGTGFGTISDRPPAGRQPRRDHREPSSR